MLISYYKAPSQNKRKVEKNYENNRFIADYANEKERLKGEIRSHKYKTKDSIKEYYYYDLGTKKESKKVLSFSRSYNELGFVIEAREFKKGKLFNHYKFLHKDDLYEGHVYLLDTVEGKKVKDHDSIFVSLKLDKQDSMMEIYYQNRKEFVVEQIKEVYKMDTVLRTENFDEIEVKGIRNYNQKKYQISWSSKDLDLVTTRYISAILNGFHSFCVENKNDKVKYRDLTYYEPYFDDNNNLVGYRISDKYYFFYLEDGCKLSEWQIFDDFTDEYNGKPRWTYKNFECDGYHEYMEIKGAGKLYNHYMIEKKYYK